MSKIYTQSEFAKKVGLSRATIWRWATKPYLKRRLKMYDAQPKEIAGKIFIEVR